MHPRMFFFDHFKPMLDYYHGRPGAGRMIVAMTIHAHVFARGVHSALARTFEHIKRHPNVWVARRGDLAQWCLEQR